MGCNQSSHRVQPGSHSHLIFKGEKLKDTCQPLFFLIRKCLPAPRSPPVCRKCNLARALVLPVTCVGMRILIQSWDEIGGGLAVAALGIHCSFKKGCREQGSELSIGAVESSLVAAVSLDFPRTDQWSSLFISCTEAGLIQSSLKPTGRLWLSFIASDQVLSAWNKSQGLDRWNTDPSIVSISGV